LAAFRLFAGVIAATTIGTVRERISVTGTGFLFDLDNFHLYLPLFAADV